MAANPVWTNLHKALGFWGEQITDNFKRLLRVDGSVASKKTRNSVDHKVLGESIAFYAEEAIGSEYTILEFIDKGRRKGATPPPWKPIAAWMKAKGIRPRSKSSGRFVKSSDTNIKRAAFAIANGISRNGIKGTGVIGRGVGQVEKEMTEQLLEAFGKDVEIFIEQNRK